MATLLLWLGFEPGAIDERSWQALECRALARAPGVVSRHRSDLLRVLCVSHRQGSPTPLRLLPDSHCLLADLGFDAVDSALIAGAQDTPAAVAHVDPLGRRLWLLRDRLGQRPLVWARVRGGVLVASGEHILLAHPQVDAAFDADYLAAYFGAAAPPVTASVYRNIHSVAAGECLLVDARDQRSVPSALQPDLSVARLPERALLDRFRQLLKAAVAQDIQRASRVGISLSAGLDSCSIAAMLPHEQRGRVLALTYGCDFLGEVDERPLAAQLARHLEIEHQGFAIDALAPLMAGGERPVCADSPISNPYREIKSELYRRASASGVDVMLTGHFADHLQPGAGHWLRSAWRHGAFGLILRRYGGLLRHGGPLALWRDRGWRHWLARNRQGALAMPWLRPEWQARLAAARRQQHAQYQAWPQAGQAAHALGSYAAIDAAGENYFTARHGIELRHPYRQVELVRFMLSLPAHLGECHGLRKCVVRAALSGCLPDAWRLRPKSISMQPLFDASIFGSESERVQELIDHSRPLWASFVDPAVVASLHTRDNDERPGLLRWLLIGFSLWIMARADDDGVGSL